MSRYLNRNARVSETFGLFPNRDDAVNTLRAFKRDLNTHTIVRTQAGFLVTCRGY